MSAFRRFSQVSLYPLLLVLAICATAVPASADQPRRNGPIIFTANSGGSWQLYRIDPDGRHFKAITSLPPTNYVSWFPQASKSGTRIVFTYGGGSGLSGGVYIINVDGTGLTPLPHTGAASDPYWSPDGRRLVYAEFPSNGRQPYLVSIPLNDPSDKTVLTSDLYASYYGLYTTDGRHIIYDSTQGATLSVTSIMDVDGRNKRPMTDPLADFCPYTPSPDGKRILLNDQCNEALLPSTIWTMNIANSQVTQLTHSDEGSGDWFPAYSPDGKKIVFASTRLHHGNLDLFTMNADGTDIRLIKTGLTIGGCPDANCVTPTWAAAQ
jgi:TolB protein